MVGKGNIIRAVSNQHGSHALSEQHWLLQLHHFTEQAQLSGNSDCCCSHSSGRKTWSWESVISGTVFSPLGDVFTLRKSSRSYCQHKTATRITPEAWVNYALIDRAEPSICCARFSGWALIMHWVVLLKARVWRWTHTVSESGGSGKRAAKQKDERGWAGTPSSAPSVLITVQGVI